MAHPTDTPAPGPRPVSALRFALSWYRTELSEMCTHRLTYRDHGHVGWRRPAWLALLCAYVLLGAAVGAVAAWGQQLPWASVALAMVLGALLGAGLLLAGYVLITALTVRLAPSVVWIEDHRGHAGAYVRPRRDGSWGVYCVHATPRGSGLGTQVMDALTATAQSHRKRLYLVASHPDAARFYARHGFVAREPGAPQMYREVDEKSTK